MNSGRTAVLGNSIYIGNGSNSPCQMACMSDIPEIVPYTHPTTKQCNYSINSDWIMLSSFTSLPAYPPSTMKNYLFGLMVVTVTFPSSVSLRRYNQNYSSGELFLYYSSFANDSPDEAICCASYSSSTSGGTGTTSDTRTQTGKVIYFPYSVKGAHQMWPYAATGMYSNNMHEMGMIYEGNESTGMPLYLAQNHCTGSLSSVRGTFYGIIPIK